MTRGTFITFEGGEGAGKSSQIRRLADRLREAGHAVVLTREPGGSPGAEAVRHVLLSGAAEKLGPFAEAALFAACRADHIDETIEPALARGDWVLCDRFYDSTRVYQGAADNVDAGLIATLEKVAVGSRHPDLTLILDVPVDVGLARVAERAQANGDQDPDRFERNDRAVHETRRQAFLAIASAEPDRCVVIDASGDMDAIAETIWTVVSERFDLPRGSAPAEPEASQVSEEGAPS